MENHIQKNQSIVMHFSKTVHRMQLRIIIFIEGEILPFLETILLVVQRAMQVQSHISLFTELSMVPMHSME